ncbi:MAG: transporter ATP-binding protein [Lachnospiraceae bacterium]|nr:transporter ATP-binding protein [Lachnospiraceae bacterium]
MKTKPVIELKNITKRFGQVVANDGIDLTLNQGEILSILGENGSGKTTLMNMLSGIYFPDEGEIFMEGNPIVIRSPKDSLDLGIGMIHQHFKLVEVFTAAENIILGLHGKEILDMKKVVEDINALTNKYGFSLEPEKKIFDMSVSEKQTVEIVKMLYRGAKVLILDEPTAVLTPQETEKLFAVLRNMRKDGRAIIIITHKLNEVLGLSDRVLVLRKGKNVDTVITSEANESSLTEMMVGKKINLDIERPKPVNPKKKLSMDHVSFKDSDGVVKLNDISFTLNSGEIFGIAGVAGSGQKELLESISGLIKVSHGNIKLYSNDNTEKELTKMNTEQIVNEGIRLAFVPEDRLGMGLVGSMDMTDNMMLRSYKERGRFLVDRKKPRSLADQIVKQLEVVTPSVSAPVSRMSGGNVQKVLVGREIVSNPEVLMVAYPVRGLDINSSYAIYNLLNEQKKKGTAVICVIEDLDVLLALCDRILVLCGGQVSGIVDSSQTTKDEIGLLMTKTGK